MSHGYLLENEYAQLSNLFRPKDDAANYSGFMLLAHFLMSGALVWIYRRGREVGKPFLGQGIRFGLSIALVCQVPFYLIYYAVQPMPGMLVAKQIASDSIAMVVVGILLSRLEHPASRPNNETL